MNLQVIFNGVVSGLVLAVLALSFSLVYLPTRVFHIALAGIVTLVPYVAMSSLKHDMPWWLAGGLALLAALAVSLMCEAINHRRLERKQASSGAHIMVSLGVYIIITQIVAMFWGNDVQILRMGVGKTFKIGSVLISQAQGVSAGVALVLLIGVFGWLRYSSLGLRFRALADNSVEFGLCEYNVNHYRLLAFGVSGLMGGVAALLTAYDVGFDPHGGLHVLILAVVSVIIGGRSTFLGPVLGGLLLGVLRSQVVWHFSARWQDVFTFLLLALFLYVRPNGIRGRASRLEASE